MTLSIYCFIDSPTSPAAYHSEKMRGGWKPSYDSAHYGSRKIQIHGEDVSDRPTAHARKAVSVVVINSILQRRWVNSFHMARSCRTIDRAYRSAVLRIRSVFYVEL